MEEYRDGMIDDIDADARGARRVLRGIAALALGAVLWGLWAAWALGLVGLYSCAAKAQSTPVFQPGAAIPGNAVKVGSNGRLLDAGGLLGEIGSGRGISPFSILDSGGLGLSFNTAKSSGAYNALRLGHAGSDALIAINSYGGAPAGGIKCQINDAPPFDCFSGALVGLIANNTVLGNVSGVTATAYALTSTELTALLNPATTMLQGAVRPDGTTLTIANGVLSAVGGAGGINQLTGDGTAGPGIGSQVFTLENTAVTAGSYTNTALTVDAKGRLTAASTGAGVTNLGTEALIITLPNDTGAGTAANKLVIYTTAAQAKTAAITDTSSIIGICVSGITGTSCGTTGNASIAVAGRALCEFDGATTAGNFIVVSTTAAGKCKDGGATVPASVAVFGQVLSTNGGAGTYAVDISPIGAMSALNSKARPGGTSGQIQYNNAGAFGGFTISIPQAVGWPAALNPNNIILANINQASTISALVGSVEVATGAAATVSVYKAPSGTACSAGTILHSGSFNANGTAATNQTLTLTATTLAAGDRVCLQTTGGANWTTGAGGLGIGTITVFLAPTL